MDPVSLATATVASVIAAAAGWYSWPRPPDLDGERWFKTILATLLRGRIEAEDGEADEWFRAVVRFVPYHPGGRLPELKVSMPGQMQLPGPALPHERALLERLAKLPDAAARWAWMYDEDEAGLAARLEDPVELGPDYAPDARVGPGQGWDALAATGSGQPEFTDALLRRLRARWMVLTGPEPALSDHFAATLGESATVVPWEEGEPGELAEALLALVGTLEADSRLIWIAEGRAVQVLLRALRGSVPVRDATVAVLSVGGSIRGEPGDGPWGQTVMTDWLGSHFNQIDMETEVVRLTPYLAAQWLDRDAAQPGVEGLPLQNQRFIEPETRSAIETIEVVDLGPIPKVDDLPTDVVARALVFVTGLWALTRL